MFIPSYLILSCLAVFFLSENVSADFNFPKNFIFGVSTSAYQIEGAWNVSGKSESNWDYKTHFHPEEIEDHSNGDISCDSYHKFDEDLRMIRELGVQSYRFSLSWSRILPEGFGNRINPDGIRYYNELIDGLIQYNITPLVTIYHNDHPQSLEEMGGWTNTLMIDLFANFARVAFENFGDRVKNWITFNEPHIICCLEMERGKDISDGVEPYLCAYTILKAHTRVYHLYKNKYIAEQKGKIGIVLDVNWHQPKSNRTEDLEAAVRAFEFEVGLFANPIFSKQGDFPTIVKERVGYLSARQNFSRSRLPQLTLKEIKAMRGAADFLGVNHYTSVIVAESTSNDLDKISYDSDINVNSEVDPSWPSSECSWLKSFPVGIFRSLLLIKVKYDNPVVYITENGFSENDIQDDERIRYLEAYLENISKAILNGCNVVRYYVWSLMDDFEWISGYKAHFGLYHVNFCDPNRTRTPRASALWYKNFIENQKNLK